MPANSSAVHSSQRGVHPRLPRLVHRHLRQPSQKPVAAHSHRAYRDLLKALEQHPRPLVLDSYCGTGMSTAALAQRHRGHLIVGIDKSAHRLARHCPGKADNYLLLQADCEDIWRLLLQDHHRVDFHYLLYPNPWPKPGHLQRRIHGSAGFASLLNLGGHIELRSNWQLYVEEFGVAMFMAGFCGAVALLPPQSPLTLFEKKYAASGHRLWRYCARVGQPGVK